MEEFEKMLDAHRNAIERFVRFRLPSRTDTDDVLQEIYFTAYRKFPQLKNRDAFKAWLISIARNKCNDYFRRIAARFELPIEELEEAELSQSRCGISETYAVRETLSLLGDKDRQILYLYFWKEMPQAEIARRLGIPVGTVKSRLHTAKQNFKDRYPYPAARHQDNATIPVPERSPWENLQMRILQPEMLPIKGAKRRDIKKGEHSMKKLPELIPEYRIEASTEAPFSVKWEELMGWFLIPRLGEKLSWGMYDTPSRKCSHVYDMEVTGRAKVHGIEGVELTAREAPYSNKTDVTCRTFVAQLTDTHCRYLAALRNDGDVRNYITFLDEDEFMPNWGFGENNCGNETNLSPKGAIQKIGSAVKSARKTFLLDIVGRYTVTIGGKQYDTVCVMDIETYNSGVVSEQFLDRNGRTILWRRFNRDNWAMDRYGKKWSEQLPENEQLMINGLLYVHWYDCITDYIL